MHNLSSSGNIEARRDIHTENIITGIQQNFTVIFQQAFQPSTDLIQWRADYLTYLHDSYHSGFTGD